VLGVGDGLGEEHPDVLVVEGVDHAAPAALADHESQVAQDAELLGYGRLLHRDLERQLTDRARSGAEAAQDPHAAGRGESLHRLGDDAGGAAVEVGQTCRVVAAHAGAERNMNT
jgi:hypothetical protein